MQWNSETATQGRKVVVSYRVNGSNREEKGKETAYKNEADYGYK